MEKIHFKWSSNELLTKSRMVQYTDFLHQRFGYLHKLNQGDFGFGLKSGQRIHHEQINNQIKVSLPSMPIIFPDGFLFEWAEQINLEIDYRQGLLLCLAIKADLEICLDYFKDEKEAFENKCIPFLKTTQSAYLLPVLDITCVNEYEIVLKNLNQNIDDILNSIHNFFLKDTTSQNSPTGKLTSVVFQSYLIETQKIKFEIAANPNLSSYSLFSLFKNLLLLTDSSKDYFDKIEEFRGLGNKYSTREASFISDLTNLIANIHLLYTHDNINSLIKWMKVLSNTIKVYSTLNEVTAKPIFIDNIQTPIETDQPTAKGDSTNIGNTPQRSKKLV